MARSLLGPALPVLTRYAELLAGPGIERGLLGPREVERLWDRHLLNCAVLVELIPEASAVADVGSGAGLPGLVLAALRPDLAVTLIEGQARRVAFLRECVDELGLTNVEVWMTRAEEVPRARDWPVVTARAVAPLAKLVSVVLPLVSAGGVLLAMKGASAADEVSAAARALAAAGATAEVRRVGEGLLDPPATVVVVRRVRRPGRRQGEGR